jgi:hypothetical protein
MSLFELPLPPRIRDAEVHSAWVLVPLSRPENLASVIGNFTRQRFPFKRLMVVENGRARGACAKLNIISSTTVVLHSASHQSSAKNIGLSEIRRRGGGFTVVMDDDDWYGPSYLAELCGYAKTYEVVGKSRNFLSMDGELWLCGRENIERQVSWVTGGALGCWAEDAAEYPLVSSGEDVAFCEKMRKGGARVFASSPYDYLYVRDSMNQHAWDISARELRNYESARGSLHLGPTNLDIVTGKTRSVQAKRLSLMADTDDVDTLVPEAPRP